MTTRGFGTAEATEVGHLVADALERPDDDGHLARVRDKVARLTSRHPVYG